MGQKHQDALRRLLAYIEATEKLPGSACALWDPGTGRAVSNRSLRLVAELASRPDKHGDQP